MVSQMKVNLPSFSNVIFGQGRDRVEQKLGEAEGCLLWESGTRNSSALNDVGRRDRGGREVGEENRVHFAKTFHMQNCLEIQKEVQASITTDK